MATSNLDLQKRKLEEANRRVDRLVEDILYTADLGGKVVDVSKMDELEQIINRLERVDFQGNVELLKATKAIYDKAIKVIDEQLKSEEIKGIDPNGKKSLEDAKQLLEKQSSLGRVGTMISRFDELSKGTIDGSIERRYIDSKIEELNYSIKDREEKEKQRREPFNKIVHVTRKPMQELDRYKEILKKIQEIDKSIKKLTIEIQKEKAKKPEEQDKEAIKANEDKIKELNSKKLNLYKSARTDENDKEFEVNAKTDKTYNDYFKRVQTSLEARIDSSRTDVINALETIKDEDIEVCGTTMKISDYLKNYMDKTNLKRIDELADKIATDKALTIRAMEQEKEHKEMEELKESRQEYEYRSENIGRYTENGNEEHQGTRTTQTAGRTQTAGAPIVYEEKKFDWKHPIKSIKNLFRKKERQENTTGQENTESKLGAQEEKNILIQIEKEMGKNFRKQYTVDEQTRISARVENTLNKQREEFYRQQNEQNNDANER